MIHDTVKLVPWREEWAHAFHKEKQAILGAAMAENHTVEVLHIGSTSIQNMASKPIIDILVCPNNDIPLESVIPDLERIGYTNLGECGRPGRYFLTSGDEPNDTFYAHLCYKENQVAQDQLLFQALERENEAIMRNYLALKTMLASEFYDNRFMYRTLKGFYIEGVLSAYRMGREGT